jgi:RNA exonuclease NGL2
MLEKAGYSFRYATGPKKRHGCLIAFKTSLFELDDEHTIFYDDEEVRSEGTEAQKIGKSFVTKNIALLISLRRANGASGGLVVGTTHLFWHPRYTYERVRQTAILTREAALFQNSNLTRQTWPCILAGGDHPALALQSTLTRHQSQISISRQKIQATLSSQAQPSCLITLSASLLHTWSTSQ